MTTQEAIKNIEIEYMENNSILSEKALLMAIKALKKTSDKECTRCKNKGKCAIYDNFNIDYCSDWSEEE